MKKVSELIGAELDYWVAKALGKNPCIENGKCMISWNAGKLGGNETHRAYFQPSVDWSLGGPIIGSEGISLINHWQRESWGARIDSDRHGLNPIYGHGETPLIAAMRACVTTKYGGKVANGGDPYRPDIENDLLERVAAFVACDASAISYQSLGQYRTALLKMLRQIPAAKETGA